MLNDLIGRVEQTQLPEKDPEAEQLLNQRLGRNPNGLYILAQTVLVQKYALEQAQAQLAQLRQQTQSVHSPPTPVFWVTCLGTVIRRHPRPRRPHRSRATGQRLHLPGLRFLRMVRHRRRPAGAQAFCAPLRRLRRVSPRARWPLRGRIVDARIWRSGRLWRRRRTFWRGCQAGRDSHQ